MRRTRELARAHFHKLTLYHYEVPGRSSTGAHEAMHEMGEAGGAAGPGCSPFFSVKRALDSTERNRDDVRHGVKT